VRWVQNALNDVLGLRLAVDGIMNAATRSAVRSFQQREGLPVDGVVGPDSERALSAARNRRAPATNAVKTPEPGITEPPQSSPAEPLAPDTAPSAAEFDIEWERFSERSSSKRTSLQLRPRRNAAPSSTVPARAALPSNVVGWMRSTDRSALELIADLALRRRLLEASDWSREYFPGNKDERGNPAPGRRAEELFCAMARVVPERRVPSSIRFHDVTSQAKPVPGDTHHKLFPEARDAFVRMRQAAAADGVRLQIASAWRDLKRQQDARGRQGNPLAVAQGPSAHMYGLAVDLRLRAPGLELVERSTRARDRMANVVRMYRSPVYKWMALNGSRFGWFPYRREPWHWEYNPPGFAARFEGNTSAGTTRKFEALELEEFEWEEEVNRSSRAYAMWVQSSLNKIQGLSLAVDGIIGTQTRSAIRSFQQRKGLAPDGIVGSMTEAALIAEGASAPPATGTISTPSTGTNPNVNALLPTSGPGFYSYYSDAYNRGHQYGQPETIRAIQAIGAAWRRRYPQGPKIGVGHISLRGGGDTPHHAGHENGLEVDFRPVRNDGRDASVTIADSAYSRALTQELVNIILANGVLKVDRILFNDSGVTPVRPASGHDNHLHVYFLPLVRQPLPDQAFL
jgi:peptidoglycan hydrolase-like protein with peptidoglycan-binding domain